MTHFFTQNSFQSIKNTQLLSCMLFTSSMVLPVTAFSLNPPVNASTANPARLSMDVPYTNSQTFYQQADAKKFAFSQGWLRLLYYPADTAPTNKNFKSRVHSASFFVSQEGQINPQAELQATLQALFSQNASNTPAKNAVQCRFPARTHWLKQQLGINQLPNIDCSETNAWLATVSPSSASLIFAEEYLDNPVSMFGHSFLRMDNAKTAQAYILNYVPKFAPHTSFAKTSYDSLIAGAKGEFTVEPYEQKIKQYRDDEGRDVWRYNLRLSEAELQQLARQIWEIKDQNLTYYLTTDNCASEILVLLDTLRPEKNYLKNFQTIVSPAALVRELQRQNLLENAVFEPSTKTKTQASINLKNHNAPFANINFAKDGQNSSNSQNVQNIQALPARLVPNDNNPQFAHGLGRVSIGVGQESRQYNLEKNSQSEKQNFTEFGYRLVYHDSLDPRSGYPAGFSLEALAFKLRANQADSGSKNTANIFDNGKVELQDFTLINARSLNPINTAENGKSWGGHISINQQSDGATQHLVGDIGGEYGWSVAYGRPKAGSGQISPNLCYALATGTAQVGKGLAKGYRAGIGANLGCIQQFSPSLRATAEVSLPFWYQANRKGDDSYWQPTTNVGVQYDLSPNNALRLSHRYTWQPEQPTPLMTTSGEKSAKLKNTQELNLQYLHYF